MVCHGLECCLLFMVHKDLPEVAMFPKSFTKNVDQERGAAQATLVRQRSQPRSMVTCKRQCHSRKRQRPDATSRSTTPELGMSKQQFPSCFSCVPDVKTMNAFLVDFIANKNAEAEEQEQECQDQEQQQYTRTRRATENQVRPSE